MIKLTFILPIFNTGKYLAKCIESTLNQSLDENEYEVLLVYDEGSTDDSLIIAKDYASRIPQVRLITHSNRSIGESLNYAFPLAKGKYVEVIDTDDFLEPNTIAPLIERMERESLDLLRINYQNVNEQYEVFAYNKHPKYKVDYSETVTDGVDFLVHRFGYACYVPTCIFERELLLRPGNEMLSIAINDAEWLPRIIAQAKRASSTPVIVYNYLIREGSKMHNEKKKYILDNHFAVLDYYVVQQKEPSTRKWYRAAIARLVLAVIHRFTDLDKTDFKAYLSRLYSYKLRPLSVYQLRRSSQLKVTIINISPRLYCWFLMKKKK